MGENAKESPKPEFSFRTREKALERFRTETFDLLVIGGGITGAAVARDAMTRGLKVALVEKNDFAYGTSSRSSKLIHGGLRYLENFEFSLVFEALAERALLLKTAPNWVRPLPFYLPVYKGDANGSFILSLGLWLYDLLALFRAPGFHRHLSQKKILAEIPFLRTEGLKGGFRYFDASMWDDVLAVETLRSASHGGAAVANYVEAVRPIWEKDRITGFVVVDRDKAGENKEIEVRAHRVVVCAGPWTDELGKQLSPSWRNWLKTSKGVHLVFDLKRIPVPGALVMAHPEDGRISFVIPRPDYGPGVVIVGTTDGPTGPDPDQAKIEPADVDYLMKLLHRYFPDLNLTPKDIISAYVGVRPLMGSVATVGSEGQHFDKGKGSLQKISREHHIGRGPGGTVIVAGGKYTTHRKMAEEISDFVLKTWKEDFKKDPEMAPLPEGLRAPKTKGPLNPWINDINVLPSPSANLSSGKTSLEPQSIRHLAGRYGKEWSEIMEGANSLSLPDPEGFPLLENQLRHTIRNEMVMHLEDFYFRRIPLYTCRQDHGLPWAKTLASVWAGERGLPAEAVSQEIERFEKEISLRSLWQI